MPKQSISSFSGVMLSIRWQNLRLPQDQFGDLEDSIAIIKNNKYSIYRQTHTRFHTETLLNKEGGIVKEEESMVHTFTYFIHKGGEKYGLFYDSLGAPNYSRKIQVDSFLVKHTFQGAKFYHADNLRLMREKKENGVIEQKYVPIKKIEGKSADTSYFCFDKRLKGLDYSFSRELDSAKKSKLYQMRFVYNAIGGPGDISYMPRRDYLFQIKKMENLNNDELDKLITTYNNNLQRKRSNQAPRK